MAEYGDETENIDFELSEDGWSAEEEEEARPEHSYRRPASKRSRSSAGRSTESRSSVRGYSRPRSDSLSSSMSSFSFSSEPLSSASCAVSSRPSSYSPQNDSTDRYGSNQYGSGRYSSAAVQPSAEKTTTGSVYSAQTENKSASSAGIDYSTGGRDFTTTSFSAGNSLSAGTAAVPAKSEPKAGSSSSETKRRRFRWGRFVFKMFFLGSFVLLSCWAACGISLESNLPFWRETFPNDWLRIAGDLFSQVQNMVGQVHELIGMIFFS